MQNPHLRRFLSGLTVTVLAVAVLANPVFSQDNGRAGMADFAGHDQEVPDLILSQISKVVRERLEADPTLEVSSLSGEATNALGMSPAIAEGQRLYEAGRVAYVNQRYEEAAQNLEQSLDYFESNVADILDWTVVGDTIFRLSTARYLAGDTDGGIVMIGRLLVYDWDFQLSADEELPEEYRNAFAKAEKSLKKTKEGSLDSSALESGTELWVDGELRGAAPMTIEGLKPGTHFVQLKKDDAVSGGLVEVEAKKSTPLRTFESEDSDASIQGLITRLESGVVDDDVRGVANKLAKRSAVPVVVTGIVFPVKEGWAVQALVFDTQVATVRRPEAVIFDKDLLNVNVDGYTLAAGIRDAVVDSKGEVVDGSVTLKPSDFGASPSESAIANTNIDTADNGQSGDGGGTANAGDGSDDGNGDGSAIIGFQDEESWYENPWIWTGVGVGVAAIAVTAIVLSVDSGGEELSGFNATVRW